MKRSLPVLLVLAPASSSEGAGPTLSPISPTSTTTCAGSFSLTLNGTNFANNAKVNFGATQLTPTTSSSTQLVVTVPASSVATAGTVSVTVVNPGGGGGTSNAQTLTINNPPPPVISSGAAATGTVGVAFTYQIVASNCPTSYNATGRPPGLSVDTATGLISGTPTTAGTYSVTISATNSSGTGTKTLVITINNRLPTTTSISPSCVTAGSTGFTLTVTGTNFVSTSTVRWGGTSLTTTFVSSTQLTATVPASLIATAGTASITVVNPAPGGGSSNAQTFTISAAPTISSLSPTCTSAGGGQFTLTVNGTNFVSGSTVNWNGTALTTSGSSTQLTATVPASLIATAGTASVTVVTPCGGTSNLKTFTIAAAPAITSPLTACGTKGG